jgi:class 3 adenylate cyclase
MKELAAGLSDQWPTSSGGSEDERKFANATVLFVDVLNYAALAEKLER